MEAITMSDDIIVAKCSGCGKERKYARPVGTSTNGEKANGNGRKVKRTQKGRREVKTTYTCRKCRKKARK